MRTDAREVRLGADRLTPDADQSGDRQIHVGQRIMQREYGRGTVVLFTECLLQAVAEVEWYTVRLEDLGKRGTVEDPLMWWADCRHCHHRITRIDDDHGVWMHCAVNGLPLGFGGGRGCRTASFDRDGDWNDALPSGKYATPKRGTFTHVVPLFIRR
ncbi:hypothetical protein [Kribbella italica]|uniref:Uncharacterized protein n=1 Tax=Kribbella italica TaxID=1540520 RepID=A0A7W9J0W4_9ACTN|nr:hypothetical protein [Kribbella italica]MBB5833315.1 hypothetical protein [Kribbella italica]